MTTTSPAKRTGTPRPVALGLAAVVAVVVVASIVVLVRAFQDDDTPVTPAAVDSPEVTDGTGNAESPGAESPAGTVTRHRDVAPFTGVDLAAASTVVVRVGEPQAVVVHAEHDVADRVTTTVRDGMLVIGGSYTTDRPVRVDIGVPTLTSVRLSGSGTVDVAGVSGRRFTADLPGSGRLTARGTTDRLVATLSGSGDMQLHDLAAEDVTARVSGSGQVRVHATTSLDAEVSGAGAIRYTGDPDTVRQDVTGAGSVVPE